MKSHYFQTICRVGIFIICAQTLVHFRSKEVYEKYIRLLVSSMILIQLLLPISRFLPGEKVTGISDSIRQLQDQWNRNAENIMSKASEADRILGQMSLEELRQLADEESILQTNETVTPMSVTGEGETNISFDEIQVECVPNIAVCDE